MQQEPPGKAENKKQDDEPIPRRAFVPDYQQPSTSGMSRQQYQRPTLPKRIPRKEGDTGPQTVSLSRTQEQVWAQFGPFPPLRNPMRPVLPPTTTRNRPAMKNVGPYSPALKAPRLRRAFSRRRLLPYKLNEDLPPINRPEPTYSSTSEEDNDVDDSNYNKVYEDLKTNAQENTGNDNGKNNAQEDQDDEKKTDDESHIEKENITEAQNEERRSNAEENDVQENNGDANEETKAQISNFSNQNSDESSSDEEGKLVINSEHSNLSNPPPESDSERLERTVYESTLHEYMNEAWKCIKNMKVKFYKALDYLLQTNVDIIQTINVLRSACKHDILGKNTSKMTNLKSLERTVSPSTPHECTDEKNANEWNGNENVISEFDKAADKLGHANVHIHTLYNCVTELYRACGQYLQGEPAEKTSKKNNLKRQRNQQEENPRDAETDAKKKKENEPDPAILVFSSSDEYDHEVEELLEYFDKKIKEKQENDVIVIEDIDEEKAQEEGGQGKDDEKEEEVSLINLTNDD